MSDISDDLLQSIIARIRTRTGKVEDAHRLEKELYEDLSSNFTRLFHRAIQKQGASTIDFVEVNDTIVLSGPLNKPSVLVIANLDGAQVFSTLAALTFLDSTVDIPLPSYFTPKVGPFQRTGNKPPDFAKRVEHFLRKRKVDHVIMMRDGNLSFDGFYVTILDENQRPLARRIVASVAERGHQTGRYSHNEDNPAFEVIRWPDDTFKLFANYKASPMGFTCIEDFRASVDALRAAFFDLASPRD